jgi:alpha-glucoside transport system permease protein
MRQVREAPRPRGPERWQPAPLNPGRMLLAIGGAALTIVILWQGFFFLRESPLPRWLTAILAIIWGVGGVTALFTSANVLIEELPDTWKRRLTPVVFVAPALAILAYFLAFPVLRSFVSSLYDAEGVNFVGAQNYVYAFTSQEMLTSFRNNALWLVVGTGFSVAMGLLIAVLGDRTHPAFETIIKSVIFMPMVISMVGASVIWRFMYDFRPPGSEQIGLLNAVVTGTGAPPQPWLLMQPWNNFFLIAIFIWLQTGYCMVILSAAIKSMPADLLEAGRIDGANEFQIFRSITLPYVQGTIITVATTVLLGTLKIFDIVQSMTGGNYATQVIANVQYTQMFRQYNYGRAAAIAIILLLAVLPVMYYNLRQFNKQSEAF